MLWFVCIVLIPLSVGWAMRSRGWSGRRMLGVATLLVLALFVVQRLGSTGDAKKIERVIEAAATSTSPGICDELMTTRYLEQRWSLREPYPDEVCESEAWASRAESVEIATIDIDGDHATVLVRNVGGSSDGSQRRIELLKEGDRWKLNRLAAIVGFDRGRWERAFRSGFVGFGAGTAAADCALGEAQRLSDEEIKRLTISDPQGVFTAIVVKCDRLGIERSMTAAVGGPEYSIPAPVVACVERKVQAMTDAELVRLQKDPASLSRLTYECGPAAFFASIERRFVDSDYLGAAEADCVVDRLGALPPGRAIRLVYDDDRYAALIASCKT